MFLGWDRRLNHLPVTVKAPVCTPKLENLTWLMARLYVTWLRDSILKLREPVTDDFSSRPFLLLRVKDPPKFYPMCAQVTHQNVWMNLMNILYVVKIWPSLNLIRAHTVCAPKLHIKINEWVWWNSMCGEDLTQFDPSKKCCRECGVTVSCVSHRWYHIVHLLQVY